MKLVVSEYIHEDAVRQLEQSCELHYDPELFANPSSLRAALEQAEALVVRNQTRVTRQLLEGAPNLRMVGRVGVGLDNLDLHELQTREIIVTWAPGTNALSVAEYVVGVMLEFCRNFGSISQLLNEGSWDRQAAIGYELHGKTLGIVGLGDIGSRLARRAGVFGMRVIATDPVAHGSSFAVQEYDVKQVELETLLGEADFISLHAPLLPTTENLINARTLELLKPSARIINTARGGLIDEEALARALRSGAIAGAALDVRKVEPPGKDDVLRGVPNLILTPHIAGVTHESNRRASLHVADDVLRVGRGEQPLSLVPVA